MEILMLHTVNSDFQPQNLKVIIWTRWRTSSPGARLRTLVGSFFPYNNLLVAHESMIITF